VNKPVHTFDCPIVTLVATKITRMRYVTRCTSLYTTREVRAKTGIAL
jgi:hypothetical protein